MTKQRTTEEFLKALKHAAWLLDYWAFCEILGLELDTYSEEKHKQFRELINYLGCFDAEAIEKLLEVAEEYPE